MTRRERAASKRRFRNVRDAPATVSVRKHPRQFRDTVQGTTWVDEYFYDYNTTVGSGSSRTGAPTR